MSGINLTSNLLQFLLQPPTRLDPFPANRAVGDAEHLRRLFFGEAAEKPELHYLRQTRAEGGKTRERLIQREESRRTLDHGDLHVVKVHPVQLTPASRRAVPARVVDEDLAHRARCEREEVVAVLPLDALGVDQFQVRLVDQRRRGHRAAGAVAPEVGVRDVAEALVDDREEPVERRRTPLPGVKEELGNTGLTFGRRNDVRIRQQVALLDMERTLRSAPM